jgi:hypothetical protein
MPQGYYEPPAARTASLGRWPVRVGAILARRSDGRCRPLVSELRLGGVRLGLGMTVGAEQSEVLSTVVIEHAVVWSSCSDSGRPCHSAPRLQIAQRSGTPLRSSRSLICPRFRNALSTQNTSASGTGSHRRPGGGHGRAEGHFDAKPGACFVQRAIVSIGGAKIRIRSVTRKPD